MNVWSKVLPARSDGEIELEVDDEEGITLFIDEGSDEADRAALVALTHNQASDLAHELLEAIRQHENPGGGE